MGPSEEPSKRLSRCCASSLHLFVAGGATALAPTREGRESDSCRDLSLIYTETLLITMRDTEGRTLRVRGQGLRRLGGRQPLWGMGVTSMISITSMPALLMVRMALSRPLPGPCT